MSGHEFLVSPNEPLFSKISDLKFNQPNLLYFPEMLISAIVSAEMHGNEAESWGKRFVYQWDSHTERNPRITVLFPVDSSFEGVWEAAIKDYFDVASEKMGSLARAIASELEGIKAQESARIAAVPITISAALLQSQFGVAGGLQPENYARIFHQMFQAGAEAGSSASSCGDLLIGAMRYRLANDSLLKALEVVIRKGILLPQVDSHIAVDSGVPVGNPEIQPDFFAPEWLVAATPYSWFHDSWTKLTSNEWVDALPPRRWVDWLATVGRLAIGMSVLWQARYLDELGELIQSESTDLSIESFREKTLSGPLIQWDEGKKSLRQRNVQPDIRALIARGAYIEKFLDDRKSKNDVLVTDSFSEAILKLRRNEFRQILRRELDQGYVKNPKKSKRYAVESCLTARSLSGEYADHYGFLVQHGKGKAKFRVVDPSTEVLALIASLACGTPNGVCNVGDVRRSLKSLGFQPSIPELVRRLEMAGLCRDSADASDAVQVKSAFRGFE